MFKQSAGGILFVFAVASFTGVFSAISVCTNGFDNFNRNWTVTNEVFDCEKEDVGTLVFVVMFLQILFYVALSLDRETQEIRNVARRDDRQERRIVSIDEKATSPETECIICRENKRIYALHCGHLVSCATCRDSLEQQACPFCRAPNTGWLRIFY
jgi:hypothetical protein